MERLPVLLNLELEGLIDVDGHLLIGCQNKGRFSKSKQAKIELIRKALEKRYPGIHMVSHGSRYVRFTRFDSLENQYSFAAVDELRSLGIGILVLSLKDKERIVREMELK
ncbi:MAG: hypothetical protein WC242_04350 [Candidatus Paceibacterota bacterium]|jgi:hypothetical protein